MRTGGVLTSAYNSVDAWNTKQDVIARQPITSSRSIWAFSPVVRIAGFTAAAPTLPTLQVNHPLVGA